MEGCLPISSIYTPGENIKDTSNPATISDATKNPGLKISLIPAVMPS